MKSKILIAFFILTCCCAICSTIAVLSYLSKGRVYAKILSTPETKNFHWVALEPDFTPEFYSTKEARNIGDNVLLFQSSYGGWDKNIHMDASFNIFEKLYIIYDKSLHQNPTIDNSATTTEIDYLSKLYNATHRNKYKKAAIRGIKYLLRSQIKNGGFPQAFPNIQYEYQKYITYNDKANINVLTLFYKIIDHDSQYDFVGSDLRKKISKSFAKGLTCLLETQLPNGGWASQYHHKTLKPAGARVYELAAVDSRETANNLLFLLQIKNPSAEILESIEKAHNWLEQNKISNHDFIKYINNDNREDIKLVECQDCLPIWARFHDISTNRAIFSDRSGKTFTDMNEISYERRNHYEWYVIDGRDALDAYQLWKSPN